MTRKLMLLFAIAVALSTDLRGSGDPVFPSGSAWTALTVNATPLADHDA